MTISFDLYEDKQLETKPISLSSIHSFNSINSTALRKTE